MRKSTCYLTFAAANILVLAFFLFVLPLFSAGGDRERIEAGSRLVKTLKLTDLCLFTEARYTRHVTQTDLNSPFQDHPRAEEHFPSGSLVYPPYASRMIRP